eukprot:1033417-Amphidinium_carterae.1
MPKRCANSVKGIRAGKPARDMRIASITPAHRSCSTTMLLSTSCADLFLFGFMHRTYCVLVCPIVSMSCTSEVLNFEATVFEAALPGALSESAAATGKRLLISAFWDRRKSRTTSSERVSLLRSSQPVAVYITVPA